MKSRNFAASLLSVQSGAVANTEFATSHGLTDLQGNGMIPRGGRVIRQNTSASLYKSGTAWTTSTAYLKADTANASFLVLFFV